MERIEKENINISNLEVLKERKKKNNVDRGILVAHDNKRVYKFFDCDSKKYMGEMQKRIELLGDENYDRPLLSVFPDEEIFDGDKFVGYTQEYIPDAVSLNDVVMFDDDKDCYIKDGAIYFKGEEIITLADCPLIGHHNYQNVMCGIAITKLLGMKNEDIREQIMSFKPPEHRLEKVREMNGITFYNDSKATNPEASIVAIDSFNNVDVALILGGRDKNTDLTEMCKSINKHIRTVLLIGEATQRFEENLIKNGFSNIIKETSMENAIDKAISLKPDVVLLSPACASFDMFKSYEHRGDVFKQYVLSK